MIATHDPADVRLASGEADVRTRREEAVIVKAEADIDAGLGIEDGDVEAWLDALETDPDAPLPSGQRDRADR